MILVCGEAVIDLFVTRRGRSEMSTRAVAGGSPFNVAIGLARLGVRTAFLSGISRDHFGAFLADRLACEGVGDGFLVRTDRPSTISIVATTDNGEPNYAFHGDGAADRSLQLAHLPNTLPDDIQALTFGSYSMAVEPVGTTFAALARRMHGRCVISVDANVRPTVVSDMQGWAVAAERFYRTATMIKASDEDVRVAWGGRLSIADAAAYWLKCGAGLVVVTEGAKGATAFSAAGSVSVPGRSVVVRDTVGAGDTFHAALLAQLAKTGRLHPEAIAALDLSAIRELLAYATAAAAITVSRDGADLPTTTEIDASTESCHA
ncbi:carbohydrate kinase family protein [Bradyrhizobium manausense]|uniref:carbohydrate kinase family protein n=1 Tax=Bradyrhizobium manausense TaxID=989370 RepID=UPI001BA608FE|nr:carbohydrate kinase [Bradyrhizobium manausense]MBR0722648.1 carbohydrate kinase [Bradyrhizobium manausense]